MAQASGQQVTIGNVEIISGSGVPAFTSPKGSLYLNTAGSSTSTRAYIQTVGGSSTAWKAVTTAA